MRNYYGAAGAANTRSSERFTQLRVRQRLAHTVRAILHSRDWRTLPRARADHAPTLAPNEHKRAAPRRAVTLT